MRKLRMSAATASTGALLLLLVGCASPDVPPANDVLPSGTPTVTLTADIDREVVALTVSADELSAVNAAGDVVDVVSLSSEVGAAVDLLEGVFSTDPTIYEQETGCEASESMLTSWSWGAPDRPSVSVVSWATWRAPSQWRSENDYYVRFSEPSEAGITLSTAEGVSVGASAEHVFDGVPADRVFNYHGDESFIAVTEVGGTAEYNDSEYPWGLVVASADSTVSAISSPSDMSEFFC
jgi:hypothetical protein